MVSFPVSFAGAGSQGQRCQCWRSGSVAPLLTWWQWLLLWEPRQGCLPCAQTHKRGVLEASQSPGCWGVNLKEWWQGESRAFSHLMQSTSAGAFWFCYYFFKPVSPCIWIVFFMMRFLVVYWDLVAKLSCKLKKCSLRFGVDSIQISFFVILSRARWLKQWREVSSAHICIDWLHIFLINETWLTK